MDEVGKFHWLAQSENRFISNDKLQNQYSGNKKTILVKNKSEYI